MNKVISIFMLITLFQECKSNDNPFVKIDSKLIEKIIISDVYVSDIDGILHSGIGIDTINYSSEDRVIIDNIFSLYLNNGKKKNIKMFYYYKLSFKYQQKLYEISIGKDCILFDGIAYKLNGNLECYLEQKLKIIKRRM